MTEKGLPRRQYTKEFVTEAVRLSQTVGSPEAGKRLGVPVGTLKNWLKGRSRKADDQAGASPAPGNAALRRPISEVEAENSRLRRELASARMDIEILRKATAYFAKGSR